MVACREIQNPAANIPVQQTNREMFKHVKLGERSETRCYLAGSEREDAIHIFDQLAEGGPLHGIVLPTLAHQKVPGTSAKREF